MKRIIQVKNTITSFYRFMLWLFGFCCKSIIVQLSRQKHKENHVKIGTKRKKDRDTVFLVFFDNLCIAWYCNWFYQDFQSIMSWKYNTFESYTYWLLGKRYVRIKVDIFIEKMLCSWRYVILIYAMGPFVFIIWIIIPITATHAKYKCFIEDYIFCILVD